MSIINRAVRRSPIASVEAEALKAAREHETGLALVDAARNRLIGAKVALKSAASSKEEQASSLLSEANTFRAASDQLAIGANPEAIREVFAGVK